MFNIQTFKLLQIRSFDCTKRLLQLESAQPVLQLTNKLQNYEWNGVGSNPPFIALCALYGRTKDFSPKPKLIPIYLLQRDRRLGEPRECSALPAIEPSSCALTTIQCCPILHGVLSQESPSHASWPFTPATLARHEQAIKG